MMIKENTGKQCSDGKKTRLSVVPDHKLSTFLFAAIRIFWIFRPTVANATPQVFSALIVSVTVSLINFAGIGV